MTVELRFWSKVVRNGECLDWVGGKNNKGYGRMRVGDKMQMAHRISWEIHYGPIPEGMSVCHHCDRTCCVEPTHLFLGTALENNLDKIQKGRHYQGNHKGENNVRSKLTAEDVLAIRAWQGPQKEIADKYGIHFATVSDIHLRKTWTHI